MNSTSNLELVTCLLGKGAASTLIGTTQSGKSTFVGMLAKNSGVAQLLVTREASGKGSTTLTEIIATDHPDLPENTLFVYLVLRRLTQHDISDDNKMLGGILFSAVKEYSRSLDHQAYRGKIESALNSALQNPENTRLEYKLRELVNDDTAKQRMLEILLSFNLEKLSGFYNQVTAAHPKKAAESLSHFTELLVKSNAFATEVDSFWDFCTRFVNQEAEMLRVRLLEHGAESNATPDRTTLCVALTKDDVDSDITKLLLSSENQSKEYLFRSMSLVFRGADSLFSDENSDGLVISEIADRKIRCFRVLDTEGLFHETTAAVIDETERVFDILAQEGSSRIILTINADISGTVKNGYEVIRRMMTDAKRDIEIYPLFTHYDVRMRSASKEGRYRFSMTQDQPIDWEDIMQIVDAEQDTFLKDLDHILTSSEAKHKPVILGCCRAALALDMDDAMEAMLFHAGITYYEAVRKLVSAMLKRQSICGNRFRVLEKAYQCAGFRLDSVPPQSVNTLFTNISQCKDKKLYASTVRACVRKWNNCGDAHHSRVSSNTCGFENISTDFVPEIRNLGVKLLPNISFDLTAALSVSDDAHAFTESLMQHLKKNQNFGREVAELIGQEAYDCGFKKGDGFAFQYERLNDMFSYVTERFFPADKIRISPQLEKKLNDALTMCVRNFIDTNCVVVY